MLVVGDKAGHHELVWFDGGVETVDEPKAVVALQSIFCANPDIALVILCDGVDIVAIETVCIVDVTGDIIGVKWCGPGRLTVDGYIKAEREKEAYKYGTRSAMHF
jgi:hypothetical protein